MMMEAMKEELYEKWFVNRVHNVSSNGKLIEVEMLCTKPALQNFYNSLYMKYKGQMNRKDFMSECYYWSYVALSKFTLLSGTWEGVIDESNTVNVAKLITYIKSYVQSNAIRFSNPNTQFTTKSIAGKTENIKINFEYSSLDSVLTTADGDVSLVEILGVETQLYHNRDDEYYMSEFVEWFITNRKQILTKKQALLLDNLPRALNEHNNTYNGDLLKGMGIDARNLTKNMNAIKNRVATKWELYQDENNNKNVYSDKSKRSNLLQKYQNALNDDRTTNKDIQNWIVSNVDKYAWLEDLIHTNLKTIQRKNYIRCCKELEQMKPDTLYAINEIIYKEHLKLKQLIQKEEREKSILLFKKAKKTAISDDFKGIYTVDAYGLHHEKV